MLKKLIYIATTPTFAINTDYIIQDWIEKQSWYDKNIIYVAIHDIINGNDDIYSLPK